MDSQYNIGVRSILVEKAVGIESPFINSTEVVG